jgi:hypothetical protein
LAFIEKAEKAKSQKPDLPSLATGPSVRGAWTVGVSVKAAREVKEGCHATLGEKAVAEMYFMKG